MEGHRLRVGALAWSSSLLSSGGRDKNIYQRDIRAQDDFVSKLSGHKSEVSLVFISYSFILSNYSTVHDIQQHIDFPFCFFKGLWTEVVL